jgi:geranylgeranyl diphosphate synthase type II
MDGTGTDAGEHPIVGSTVGIDRINVFLSETVERVSAPENLRDAIGYALLNGGKRIRPMLAWAACEAVGGKGSWSLPAGAALELVHAFSLVHDDLPAMDDDDLRRGRPTLHVHTGEAMAILAGDAMLATAFEVLLGEPPGWPEGATWPAAALIRELSTATGAMIAGQVYDTLGGFDDDMDPQARLELIHRNKTGALIRAACRMGGLCGLTGCKAGEDARRLEATAPGLLALTRFGEAVGLMFQITDDLLDVEETAERIGKRTRKDHEAGKLTYPGVIGVEASRTKIRTLAEEATAAIEGLGRNADGLRKLCRLLAERKH